MKINRSYVNSIDGAILMLSGLDVPECGYGSVNVQVLHVNDNN